MTAESQEFPEPHQILSAIIKHVCEKSRDPLAEQSLTENPTLLYEKIQSTKMDWARIGEELHTTRDRVYHWYFETYLRKVSSDKISKQEKALIQRVIIDGIQSRRIEDPNFQQEVREQIFGKERAVHRSEFSIIYNNIIRCKQIRAMLSQHKIELPSRRAKQDSTRAQDLPQQQQQQQIQQQMPQQSYTDMFKTEQQQMFQVPTGIYQPYFQQPIQQPYVNTGPQVQKQQNYDQYKWDLMDIMK
ncbi:Conserved_hypothetical protein [Hexamita inflata]|uniref:Uncharacterized protein n=1 Tax=Hexamita inflata TaxID=28002 RepID=A0AA86U4F3_9EUKA|nr:Conserved hypothetical protein [Hexamita inflata]CAI9942115.1 Conserved hypothetical protein [Hexamita inflata]CAI9974462.1 Conserved hypothetical protein [Hexamita inflata]